MWLRLRQICLVTNNLTPLEKVLYDVLRINVAYRDPGIDKFGLENALFPIGNQLLEVVSPIDENTAGGRYLERRGGDGGYMFITQCDDHAPRRARVDGLGIRLVYQFDRPTFRNFQMHPKDTGGTFFEINEQLGPNAQDADGPWWPAGPDWKAAQVLDRVNGIAAAEVQCDNPAAVAGRWSEIAEIPLIEEDGIPVMPLDNAKARFVSCTDGRPEGIDVVATDKDAILAAAKAINAQTDDNQIYLCGMRIKLV